MISYLKGKVKNKGLGFVVVDVRDVGYKVFVNEVIYAELEIEKQTELYIYSHIREDAFLLFGFYSMAQLEMFEMLLSVSGVGPKSALGVLGIAPIEDIKDAIARGDSSLLIKVSGIGKKTAERMVLELRDKVDRVVNSSDDVGQTGSGRVAADEIDALVALGYSLQQARDALRRVDSSVKDSGERIKEALKSI